MDGLLLFFATISANGRAETVQIFRSNNGRVRLGFTVLKFDRSAQVLVRQPVVLRRLNCTEKPDHPKQLAFNDRTTTVC